MPSLRRGLLSAAFLAPVLSGLGCNAIASTLGFSPPIHKLSPAAEQFRMANAAAAPIPKELTKSVLPAYILEPGDTLTVEPADLDSPVRLPGSQPVLPDGTIDLGKYGRPMVAGKSVEQIEADVRKMIAAQEKDKAGSLVNVRLIGRESKVYYVLGEVNSPRAYPLAGRETVLDGILTAGGITRQADVAKIILSRPSKPDGCRVVLPVCYLNIVQLGDTSTNYQLQPGDRIYLPSQSPFDGFSLGSLCGKKKDQPCGPCMEVQTGCGPAGYPVGPAGDVMIPVAPPAATPPAGPPTP